MTGGGLPAAITSEGISRVTTLPAPMTDRSPMVTPGQMMAPPPTHTSEPMVIGCPAKLWFPRIVKLAREHLVFFRFHRALLSSNDSSSATRPTRGHDCN